jgi:hypothetical protein
MLCLIRRVLDSALPRRLRRSVFLDCAVPVVSIQDVFSALWEREEVYQSLVALYICE